MINTPKIIPVNAVDITHNDESFCLTFVFQTNDGALEKVVVVISPSGAKTTKGLLEDELKSYEMEHGTVEPWQKINSGPSHNNRLTT